MTEERRLDDQAARTERAEERVERAEQREERRRDSGLTESLLAGLAVRTGELVAVSHDLAKAAALSRGWRAIIITLALFGTVGSVAAAIDGFLILHGQQETHRTATRIQDCTDPGDRTTHPPRPAGKCYQRGQAQTADAVKTLVEQFNEIDRAYSVIVDECAHAPDVVACFHTRAREAGLEK